MVTLHQVCEAYRRRNEANPEAAQWRKRITDLVVENSWLHASLDDGWLTQSQAAVLVGLHRGTINRAIKAGKIVTNGCAGHQCRIHPESLFEFYDQREAKQLQRLNN